ncbi:unnamed protein product [Mycena citricolor]|uniref:Uncharacterized protein n=1 Tax=Mycena citricolor TaxID=2018698 RepID=A0AAD2GUX2_9AGAR|nr:unnamed protein product [Mycena citricolor]
MQVRTARTPGDGIFNLIHTPSIILVLSLQAITAAVTNDHDGNLGTLRFLCAPFEILWGLKTRTVKKPVTKPKAVSETLVKPKPVARPIVKQVMKPVAKPIAVKKPTAAAKKHIVPTKVPALKAAMSTKSTPAKNIEAREFLPLEEQEYEHLVTRAGLGHPSGRSDVNLFRVANTRRAAQLVRSRRPFIDDSDEFDLGDLDHSPEVAVGFYLTGSLMSAARFECFGKATRPSTTDVLEYRWSGSSARVADFSADTTGLHAFQHFNANPVQVADTRNPSAPTAAALFQHDMITALFSGHPKLTPSLRHYAVIRQSAADSRLQLVARYRTFSAAMFPLGHSSCRDSTLRDRQAIGGRALSRGVSAAHLQTARVTIQIVTV